MLVKLSSGTTSIPVIARRTHLGKRDVKSLVLNVLIHVLRDFLSRKRKLDDPDEQLRDSPSSLTKRDPRVKGWDQTFGKPPMRRQVCGSVLQQELARTSS